MKSAPLIWHYVVGVKLTVKIFSIFVAFLENMNFRIRNAFVLISVETHQQILKEAF